MGHPAPWWPYVLLVGLALLGTAMYLAGQPNSGTRNPRPGDPVQQRAPDTGGSGEYEANHRSDLGKRVTWPVKNLPRPSILGVHQAIGVHGTDLPYLTKYVSRSHDARLRQLVEGIDRKSMIVVLIGDSSTGKSRAWWEALQHLPDEWSAWSPADARELSHGLSGDHIGSHTVVWLNDAHNYLDPALTPLAGSNAAHLRERIANTEAGPILVAATMWPRNWQQLTAQPRESVPARSQVGGVDGAILVAAVLETAVRIQVPQSFQSDDLDAVHAVADGDPRLALALAQAPSGKITQYLAGALKLQERYESAPPEMRALVDAAIDARRLGHGNALPEQLLVDAAVGYLDADTWDQLSDDWSTRALSAMSSDWRGLPGPLTPIRSIPNSPPKAREYRIADALEQTGIQERRYSPAPEQFWSAIADHGHTDDLAGIGYAAQQRGRYLIATNIYLKAAAANSSWALHELALMREEAGDHTNAENLAHKAAQAGDCDALKILAMHRQQSKDPAAEERLYQWAVAAGDTEVLAFLPGMREKAGDHAEAERLALEAAHNGEMEGIHRLLRMWAKAGKLHEAEQLARQAADMGETSPLNDVAGYWDIKSPSEAERVYKLAAEYGDTDSLWELAQRSEKQGEHAEAERLVRKAGAGDTYALCRLARERLDAGRQVEATRLYKEAADLRDSHALGVFARSFLRGGNYTQAEAFAARAAEAGNVRVLRKLARDSAQAGDWVRANGSR